MRCKMSRVCYVMFHTAAAGKITNVYRLLSTYRLEYSSLIFSCKPTYLTVHAVIEYL